ncbi:MAG: NTP transferase domain-containing protein [Acetobacteraceae bacterium]|nr:NTP transferase domain-containing protein [Acetobacteraceae bacterium]
MRAVVMAGGEGTRLRPLTCRRPKPLVPLVNRPVMAYSLNLLRRHGARRAVVSVHHLGHQVMEEFGEGEEYGLNLAYSLEESPRGTAGGVRQALRHAAGDGPVLVLSGDTLTDLDLGAFLDFHRSQGAVATLALVRVPDPSPYGAVITSPRGQVVRFLEKPGPGEEFSDWVNTGVYLLEEEALEEVPDYRAFDFSRDLFPLLLSRGLPLAGFKAAAYWCDIGHPGQYLEASFAILEGRAGWAPPGREVGRGLWVDEAADVSEAAELRAPVAVGRGCRVEAGARVGPLAVLGPGCRVEAGARVERSVLWSGASVGRAARVRGAILGAAVRLNDGVCVCEGAVVGDGTALGARSSVRPGVRLWPGRLVEAEATVDRSLAWGGLAQARRVPGGRARGLVNLELGPEQAARIALAFGSVLGDRGRVVFAGDAYPSSRMLQGAVGSGLEAAGREALNLGVLVAPALRHLCRALRAAGAVHVGRDACDHRYARLDLWGEGGRPLSRDQERRLEQALAGDDFPRPGADRVRPARYFPGAERTYLAWLTDQAGAARVAIRRRGFRIVADCDGLNLGSLLSALADELGLALGEAPASPSKGESGPAGSAAAGASGGAAGAVPAVPEAPEGPSSFALSGGPGDDVRLEGPFLPWGGRPDRRMGALAAAVRERQADLGVALDPNAEGLALVGEGGQLLTDGLLFLLVCRILAEDGGPGTVVHLPPGVPRAGLGVVARAGGRAVPCPGWPPAGPQLHLWGDALAVLVRILAHLASRNLTLGEAVASLPQVHLSRRWVACPWHRRGEIIRRLAESGGGGGAGPPELEAGIRFYHGDRSVRVSPHPAGPLLCVTGEAETWEAADELALTYADLVERLRREKQGWPW